MTKKNDPFHFESKLSKFESLMQFRVRHVLLVASPYDSFVLEEDGQLTDLIYNEFTELNLSATPFIRRAANAAEALDIMRTQEIDVVLVFKRVSDINVEEFGRKVKKLRPQVPVVLLVYQEMELQSIGKTGIGQPIDWTFVWTGQVKLLLSIIKMVEDRKNVERDTRLMGVRVIILVEDSVKFYSSYLPLLYTEILQHTRSLMVEGLNMSDRLLRMRARPKILLATDYEEAWDQYRLHKQYVLGIISDMRFNKAGTHDPEAGLKLVREVRKKTPELPILMQSSEECNKSRAASVDAGFLHKGSTTLHAELRSFITDHFGFGDFVFRLPDGSIIARATGFHSMERTLARVDERSILYHASRNHFSNWLMARTEFELANRLRPRKVSEFKDVTTLRRYLIDTFRNFRHERQLGEITDFERHQFDLQSDFVRIGGGSLGGKGRGLAFVNSLLSRYYTSQFPGVRIRVPLSATLGTDVFDTFMEQNRLWEFALNEESSDEEINKRFVHSQLPSEIVADLDVLMANATYPLAVRSSSLLEDSHLQPFAGVYDTHMLPNNHTDRRVRLFQLETAIKMVYASAFRKSAKNFHRNSGFRIEEERMAVILQQAIGCQHGNYFYPHVSGVGMSYNYYSMDGMHPDDGIAYLALGMGKTIVEGGNCLRVCPKYPQKLFQFSTTNDMLDNSQRRFYAIDLKDPAAFVQTGGETGLVGLDIDVADHHDALNWIASTYSPENDRIHAGTARSGVRIITFAPILSGDLFPLAEVIDYLLKLGSQGLNCPVEIEFAVNLGTQEKRAKDFYFLQIRPMTKAVHFEDVSLKEVDKSRVIARSENTLGNMHVDYIDDVIVVDPETFDRSKTMEIAGEVAKLNARLHKENRQYLLIGPGRWGTSEKWLGIPVQWQDISSARVIVEVAYGDFAPDPSFGTHFFQNLTSFEIGYLTVNEAIGNGWLDFRWLENQRVAYKTDHVKHLRLDKPLDILIDGHEGAGVILRDAEVPVYRTNTSG